jgi:hypothetical protein
MPPPPWSKDDYLEFGLIRGFNSARIKTLHAYALNMIDLDQNKAIYWIPDAKNVPYYHAITPLRPILHWWFCRHQRFIVHAAAVGISEGGVLITGKGSAGKSTTAISCIGSGLKYVGDENCLISAAPEPYVQSLYCSGTLEAKDIDNFPSIKSFLSNANRLRVEKAVYYFFKECQQYLSNGFVIRAVFVPEISRRPQTSIKKRSFAQTLLALAPGSLFQLPDAGGESFHAMAALLRRVPSYTLELGTDLPQIPILIKRFLRSQL